MQYLYPLIAIHSSGVTILLYTNEAVLKFIQKYGRFHDHHVWWWGRFSNGVYLSTKEIHPWIVRDDRGRIVKYDDVCYKHKLYDGWNKRNAEIEPLLQRDFPSLVPVAVRLDGR